jgi:hypothetical protein
MTMKKLFLVIVACALSLGFMSCGNSTKQAASGDSTAATASQPGAKANAEFPWDFPQGMELTMEVGQNVLSPYTFYPQAIKDGKDIAEETYILYSTTVDSVGKEKSKVGGAVMPNALIIPLPKDVSVQKGDIVLTWWQSGSGMQRAIVKDASDPKQPVVDYLDLKYEEDAKDASKKAECFAVKFGNAKLAPNTFLKIEDGKWMPGQQIAVNESGSWKACTIINCNEDKVLALCFAGKIKAYKKSDCKLVPFNVSINKGDAVKAVFVDSYSDGYKVEKVDKNIGRVWVTKDGRTSIVNLLEVAKNL